jgi:methylmalonyl-CoA mutase cobalamin-binding subunit
VRARRAAGVDAISPPGAAIAAAAQSVLERLKERRGYVQRGAA